MSIKSVVDLVKHLGKLDQARKWLIIGKGPSSDLLANVNTDSYYTVALNHACLIHYPTIAHFTDLEAFSACERHLSSKNHFLALPWHPHSNMKPGKSTLLEYASLSNTLTLALKAKRLYSYNSSLAHKLPANPELPIIRVRYFSAVAAFNILAASGVKEIFSLGVDGGTSYGQSFQRSDLLSNGRPSFDIQFKEIDHTCKLLGVRHIPLVEVQDVEHKP